MSYSQQSFPQIQGINGKYTIAQIGCLITAFCNLLGKHGTAVDPATLNSWFAAHATFIDVDDGVRDDLSWSSVTAYNPNLTVKAIGSGVPATDEAIVKFSYISPRTGKRTTHFCLWLGNNTILDSWDGKTKNINTTSYGAPVAYATYNFKQPESVKPVSVYTGNLVSTPNRYERFEKPLDLMTKRECEQWFLDFKSYPNAKSNGHHGAGERFMAVGQYKHPLGDTYFMNEFDFDNADKDGTPKNNLGYNVVDLKPYEAPAAPVAIPVAEVTASAPEPATAAAPEPTEAPAEQIPVTVLPTEPVTPAVPEAAWKGTFKTNYAGEYIAVADETVFDYSTNPATPYPLSAGQPVHVIGTFQKGTSKYYRASRRGQEMWVGIPMSKLRELQDDELFAEVSKDIKAYDAGLKANSIKTIGFFDGLMIRFTNLFRKNKKK